MESIMTLNRIEILGHVGNIRVSTFEDRHSVNLSVITNYIYKGRDAPVVEEMWFNITGWEGKAISTENLNALARGSLVRVLGGMRERTYTGTDDTVKKVTEVVASTIEIVKDTDAFQAALT